MKPTFRICMPALAFTLLASLPAQASKPGYFALEREIRASGRSEAEASVRFLDKARSVSEKMERAWKTGHHFIRLTQVTVDQRFEGSRWHLGGSVRFLIYTCEADTPLRKFFLYNQLNSAAVKGAVKVMPDAPAALELRASGHTPSRVVRYSINEAVRLADSPQKMSDKAGGMLLQDAWRRLLSDLPSGVEATPESTVRVPVRGEEWEFDVDTDRLKEVLGLSEESPPLYRISAQEVLALERAFEILVDPRSDQDLRELMETLRRKPLPPTTAFGKRVLRSLLDPEPVAKPKPTRGLAGLGGAGD